MCAIFEVQGNRLDMGYVNIREAQAEPERELKALIEEMWSKYEPFAEGDFCEGFARDVDGRFWEMLLGCTLLDAGYELLRRIDRPADGGQPDLCVLCGTQRIWIEAIAPTIGDPGPDQVIGPMPLNEGGGIASVPVRQAQIRTTAAFWTKSRQMARYLNQGAIAPGDVRLIAISACRFGLYASEDPPLVMSSLFPIGAPYVTVNRRTGDIVECGFQHEAEIDRQGGPVPRTAFFDRQFSHVSGVIWSRLSLGNLSRDVRPITLVHNPFADVPVDQLWGPWDREFVSQLDGDRWHFVDVRNS